MEIIQRLLGRDEFDQALALSLHHRFLEFAKVALLDRHPPVLAAAGDAAEGGEGGAAQEGGGVLHIPDKILQGDGSLDC